MITVTLNFEVIII